MKWFINLAVDLFVVSSVVSADESKASRESLIHLSQPEFHDQVASQSCGYWDERLVEVCDYRTVLVNEPYTACHYDCVSGPCGYYPTTLTRTHAANHNCQTSLTLGPPFGYQGNTIHPAGYQLSSSEQLTRQVERTEAYNCRMEHRMVWVQLPSHQCGFHPHEQATISNLGLSWQYAPDFASSPCPRGSIPSSAPLQTLGAACSVQGQMARTFEATTSHIVVGPSCSKALQCQ